MSPLTLVLDPKLGERVRAFIVRSAEESGGKFQCVVPEQASNGDTAELRVVLRDTARAHENPLLVLSQSQALDYFEGAGLPVSFVESLRPGYRLTALPDLLPKVSPVFFDTDGMPMIPDESRGGDRQATWPGIVREYEQQNWIQRDARWLAEAPDWKARIEQFAFHSGGGGFSEDGPLTFRLDWLLPDVAALAGDFEQIAGGGLNPGLLWLSGNRVMSLLPVEKSLSDSSGSDMRHYRRRLDYESAKAAIARYHEVHEVRSLTPLREAIGAIRGELNPDGEGDFDFDLSRELRAFEEETGVALSIDCAWLRVKKPVYLLAQPATARETFPARRCSDADTRLRAILEDLLMRDFEIENQWDAAILFSLETVRNAPLAHLVSEPTSMSALANVGAGHVVRIGIRLFPRESPGIVKAIMEGDKNARRVVRWDGNDIRLSLETRFQAEKILEGTTPRAVVNHRIQAAKAAEDARNDD